MILVRRRYFTSLPENGHLPPVGQVCALCSPNLFLKLLPRGMTLDTVSQPGANSVFGDPERADRKGLCVNGTGKSEAVSKEHLCVLSPPGTLSHMPYKGRAEKERSVTLLRAPRVLPVPPTPCLLSRIYQ